MQFEFKYLSMLRLCICNMSIKLNHIVLTTDGKMFQFSKIVSNPAPAVMETTTR